MFAELITLLNENGRGLNAFRKCADAAKGLAQKNPDYATEFFVLAVYAENFVDFHERMAVDLSATAKAADQFVKVAEQFDAAITSGSAQTRLGAMNEVVTGMFAA
ncbi:MAG: hypothetical protein MRY67_13115 [Rhodovulum sp.]|jgi:hypothetical protein|nr:hypothetical protein [Rhodovulum sp.]MCI5086852.1 hypothetical protein [Rhodovulum sp.]|tara:strand:+ start:999 stop:1313 length:315 start_codon:yes stop_codon:yes gene_type:complete